MGYYYEIATNKQTFKNKTKERFDKTIPQYQLQYQVGDEILSTKLKLYLRQKKSNGSFQTKEIIQNSALLNNHQTNQTRKVNFNRQKQYFELKMKIFF